jgi:hypothetical protein
VNSAASAYGIAPILGYSLSQAAALIIRIISLVILSAFSVLGLKDAVYTPYPRKMKTAAIIVIGIGLVFVSNFLIGIQTSGVYHPELLGALYFLSNGGLFPFLLGFPIQLTYYFSEIIMMNYTYVLAKKGWSWRKGPITSATIFLILGWASLHAITKDIFVAIDGIVLVLLFYITLEYAEKSPMGPIILWFAQLIS